MPPKKVAKASVGTAEPEATNHTVTTKIFVPSKAAAIESASTKSVAMNKRKIDDDSSEDLSELSEEEPAPKKPKVNGGTSKPATSSKAASTKKALPAKKAASTSSKTKGRSTTARDALKASAKSTALKNGKANGVAAKSSGPSRAPASKKAGSSTAQANAPDYPSNTVAELKDLLRARSLPLSGAKPDLVARLQDDDNSNNNTNGHATSSAPGPSKAATKKKAVGVASASTTLPSKASAPKKRKATEDESAGPTTTAQPKAAKKPKVVKPRDIINHAPTQRLNVFVCGEGGQAELGLGTAKNAIDVKRPRLNPLLSAKDVGVVHVACGGMHSAVLTHDNKILTWGVNDQGALGRDTTWEGGLRDNDQEEDDDSSDSGDDNCLNPLEATPTPIDMSAFPEGTVITQLAATDSATFALTAEGDVYGWGTFRGNEGIIGFAPKVVVQAFPALVSARGMKQVKKIACGDNHVLALTIKGETYAWGAGQQHQLGRKLIERSKEQGLNPATLGLKKNIENIACGAFHSFAIDKSGNVFTWGLNSFGETGIPDNAGADEAVILHPRAVESLKGHGELVSLAGGAHHSVAVTKSGTCLVWGRMDGFQTGLQISSLPDESIIKDECQKPRILMKPTPLPGITAKFATAGSEHTIAITTEGKAYSWGFSGNYQTGQGSDDDIEVATLIDNTAVRDQKLNWAGAGGQYSVLTSPASDDVVMNGA